MKFTSILLFATSALSAATYSTLISDLKTISSNLASFDKTLATFTTGGPSQSKIAAQLDSESNTILSSLKKAVSDAKAAPYYGDAGSLAVSQAVLALYPDTITTLNSIVAHMNQFMAKGADLQSTVESQLKAQSAQVTALGNAVTPKLNSAFKKAAPCLIAKFTSAFSAAEKKFASM